MDVLDSFPRRSTILLAAFLVFCCSALGTSCSGAEDGPGGDNGPVTTVVTGLVSLAGPGTVVPGARISAGSQTTVSDSDGRFQLPIDGSATTLLTIEHDDYGPAYRRVTPNGATLITVPVMLHERTWTTTVDVRAGAQNVVFDSAQAYFPHGSLVLESGAEPPGPVDLATTLLDRTDAVAAPAPLAAMDGGELTPLTSYGMAELTLSYQGDPVRVADGHTVTLQIAGDGADPASAGLFYLDPAQGMWVEEGTAIFDGAIWIAELEHLSWWNVDAFSKVPPDQRTCLRIITRDPFGRPIPGVYIDVRWGPGNSLSSIGTTDAIGTLCSNGYPSEQLTITAVMFLGGDAQNAVLEQVTVTPVALGAVCESPDCQEVVITLSCVDASHCASGAQCDSGACTGSGSGSGGSGSGTIPQTCQDFIDCMQARGQFEYQDALDIFGPGGSCYEMVPPLDCPAECLSNYNAANCTP